MLPTYTSTSSLTLLSLLNTAASHSNLEEVQHTDSVDTIESSKRLCKVHVKLESYFQQVKTTLFSVIAQLSASSIIGVLVRPVGAH